MMVLATRSCELNKKKKVRPFVKTSHQLQMVKAIASSDSHTVLLDEKRRVWIKGRNNKGQLGTGSRTKTPVNRFCMLTNLPPIEMIATSRNSIANGPSMGSTIMVDDEGRAWAHGRNKYGQLGLGFASKVQDVPICIPDAVNIRSISCGKSHTLMVDEIGKVYGCGKSSRGQLGVQEKKPSVFLKAIRGLPAMNQVYCGLDASYMLDREGTVWVCGGNECGQLGLGHNHTVRTPEKLSVLSQRVKSISTYCWHAFFMDIDGSVWATGDNSWGQLVLGDSKKRNVPEKITLVEDIKVVATGNIHSVLVTKSGAIWVVGSNYYGQIGLGADIRRDRMSQPVTISNLPIITNAFCGMNITYLEDETGELWVSENKMQAPFVKFTERRKVEQQEGAREEKKLESPEKVPVKQPVLVNNNNNDC